MDHEQNRTDTHFDFAELWRRHKGQDQGSRMDDAADLAFWKEYAPRYDARTGPPGSYDQTLRVLSELVMPSDSLLDVGAGTGRFAVPLAQRVRSVTALDYAAPMLDILRRKLRSEGLSNVSVVEASWEKAEAQDHDVVLAAWSLYRQLDLTAAMQKLIACTRRVLIIVDGDDDAMLAPHYRLRDQIWGGSKAPGLPKPLFYTGVLWQLGVHPEICVVHETRRIRIESPEAIAGELSPAGAAEADIAQFAIELKPFLKQDAEGWSYVYSHPVDILVLTLDQEGARSATRLTRPASSSTME